MRTNLSAALWCTLVLTVPAIAQTPGPNAAPPAAAPATSGRGAPRPQLQRLGKNLLTIGAVRIDTERKQVSIPGTITEARLLEFVATTPDGLKEYESALRVETDAISLNTALLLIGLDPAHARVPARHFDPIPPAGDRVELSIEWTSGGETRRAAVEELLYDRETQKAVPAAPWVYTGSQFLKDGRFMAQIDGVLIGFVHSPSPLIENVGGVGVNRWGAIIINPTLGLQPKTPVTLTIKAVG